jgi:hypothetical protein
MENAQLGRNCDQRFILTDSPNQFFGPIQVDNGHSGMEMFVPAKATWIGNGQNEDGEEKGQN